MDRQILMQTVKALENNRFEVYVVATIAEAEELFFNKIFPQINPKSVTWGDSETIKSVGIIPTLEKNPDISIIRTFGEGMSYAQKIYWRRQALLADLFITGTNAITQKGQLVNLDMIGNRVSGITFGPEHVVLFIGTNKITKDLEDAMHRVRTHAAPQNILRHPGYKTPCRKTGTCMDCNSPQRICNTWTITEKCYPAGRTKIILIDQELGL